MLKGRLTHKLHCFDFIELTLNYINVRWQVRNFRNLNYKYCNTNYIIFQQNGYDIIHMGDTPMKLYSIYAPHQHLYGTIHRTKEDAEHTEKHCDCW